MKRYHLTTVVWKEGKDYVSICPELGVASCGDSLEEAKTNLEEAVELYIENAKELGMLDDLEVTLKAKEKFTSSFELVVR